jgi:phosphoribosylglycinamide formyltransferase 1
MVSPSRKQITAKYNLAILASGAGSNADKICTYFKGHPTIRVELIITNRSNAGVLQIASFHEVESFVIPRSEWYDQNNVSFLLESRKITHIILAGFLLLIPEWLIEDYRGRIINIHPALLPNYGGKGMYGMNVHQRVKAAGDLVSGITIHQVDEHYDNGDIIFQEKVELTAEDTPEEIAKKVLKLEHYHYPRVIEDWILSTNSK